MITYTESELVELRRQIVAMANLDQHLADKLGQTTRAATYRAGRADGAASVLMMLDSLRMSKPEEATK